MESKKINVNRLYLLGFFIILFSVYVSAPPCTNRCSPSGARQCSGNGYQTCGNYDADSCLEWSSTINCGSGLDCYGGWCIDRCYDSDSSVDDYQSSERLTAGTVLIDGSSLFVDDCTTSNFVMERYCSGISLGNYEALCGSGYTCVENAQGRGYCAQCTNQCSTAGARQCSGNGYQTCVTNEDSDPCLEWSSPATSCPSGQTCQAGTGNCVTSSCTNECSPSGTKRCYSYGYQTCGDYDHSDTCLEWSGIDTCTPPQVCAGNGICCYPNCASPSTVACGTVITSCVGPCQSGTQCPSGQACSSGRCIAPSCSTSDGACPTTGCTHAQDVDCNNVCGVSGNGVCPDDCTNPPDTDCSLSCTNECTSGQTGCSGDNTRRWVCGEISDGDSCLDIVYIETCSLGQTCQNGQCVTSCTPTTEICNGVDDDCDTQIDEGDVCVECAIDTDCDDPNLPFCIDGECAECINDNDCNAGEICENNQCTSGECQILDTFWSRDGESSINTIGNNQGVFLVVQGSSACGQNNLVDIEIFRDIDPLTSLLDISLTTFSGLSFDAMNNIKQPWLVDRATICSSVPCILIPEIYFKAVLDDEQEMISENLEVLDITETTCGNSRIDIGEICDTGLIADNSDDVFANGITDCEDHNPTWSGDLSCIGCTVIDTSQCRISCNDDNDCPEDWACSDGFCQGTAECGNDVIEPGESCEEDLFLGGITDCSDIPLDSSWEGDLECDDQCQIRQSTENPCEIQGYGNGYNCVNCEDCGDIVECDATICINYCGGNGACNYVGEPILGDQCIECTGTLECNGYEHPASCNYDVCNTLFNTGFTCEWSSVNNECNTNTNCEWDCDGLYEQCSGDGFAYKQSGFSCVLISGDCDAVNDNPALRYPEKIACGLNEENFPVFTLFNLIISLILIIGYYVVTLKGTENNK